MKHVITTILGDFTVHMEYQPSSDDMTLNNFTRVINRFATQPMIMAAKKHSELHTINDAEKLAELAISLMKDDEAIIEKALYDSTRASGGTGRRLNFSLSKREIDVSKF